MHLRIAPRGVRRRPPETTPDPAPLPPRGVGPVLEPLAAFLQGTATFSLGDWAALVGVATPDRRMRSRPEVAAVGVRSVDVASRDGDAVVEVEVGCAWAPGVSARVGATVREGRLAFRRPSADPGPLAVALDRKVDRTPPERVALRAAAACHDALGRRLGPFPLAVPTTGAVAARLAEAEGYRTFGHPDTGVVWVGSEDFPSWPASLLVSGHAARRVAAVAALAPFASMPARGDGACVDRVAGAAGLAMARERARSGVERARLHLDRAALARAAAGPGGEAVYAALCVLAADVA